MVIAGYVFIKMYSHKLKGFIFTTSTYSSISLLWMNSLSESPTRTFVLILKRKYIFVKAFNVSLFALNQSAILKAQNLQNRIDFLDFLKNIVMLCHQQK